MHRILCFGDSNTWGYNPETGHRYEADSRWPRIAATELGTGYEVLEEGLNGRTTVWEDPIEEYKCGKSQIVPILKSHQPLGLVVILLGTNDLKHRFSLTAYDIAGGAGTLVGYARSVGDATGGPAPDVLLLAPPPVARLSGFAQMFSGAEEKSANFGLEFGRVAEDLKCHFLDLGGIISSSPLDGIHLDRSNQRKLGLAVAEKIREILR
jgi:lysophospholipase L1-like esterase